jgi:outer membrane protein assembly factor BamB
MNKRILLFALIFALVFIFINNAYASCYFGCAQASSGCGSDCSMHLWAILGFGDGVSSCTVGSFYDSGAWNPLCWPWDSCCPYWGGCPSKTCNGFDCADCLQSGVRYIKNNFCPNTGGAFDEDYCTIVRDCWCGLGGCCKVTLTGKWDAPYTQCVLCDYGRRMKVERLNDPFFNIPLNHIWDCNNPPQSSNPILTTTPPPLQVCEHGCGASQECDNQAPSYTTCTNGAPQNCNYNSPCNFGPPNPKCDSSSICGGDPRCNGKYVPTDNSCSTSISGLMTSCVNCGYSEYCDITCGASNECSGKQLNYVGCTSASACGGHCLVDCSACTNKAKCSSGCGASGACNEVQPGSYQCTAYENGDYYYCDANCNAGSWQDCGVSGCNASCPGVGCGYDFKYCSIPGGCKVDYRDIDNYENYCKTCMANTKLWNPGGDISGCCGDDPNEFFLTCRYNTSIWLSVDDSPCKGITAINEACCDSSTDCVWKDNCISNGARLPTNSSIVCNNGVWDYAGNAGIYEVRIFDEEAHYCRVTGCGNAYGNVIACQVQESEGNLTTGTLIGANQPPDYPAPPDGPSRANVGETVSFTANTTDPDGDQIKYIFDWGDGTTSESAYVDSGNVVVLQHIWNSAGKYCVKVKAVDNNSLSYGFSGCHYITINAPPSTPIIYGPTFGKMGESYNYNVNSVDPEGDAIYYTIFWEYPLDVPNDTSPIPVNSGLNYTFSHIWNGYGTFCIKAIAVDVYGAQSALSPCLNMRINSPPRIPKLIGPDVGAVGNTYEYMANTTDPDGDQIKYIFDWGDGTNSSTGLVNSGTAQNRSHTWNSGGIYCVRAKAVDNNSFESAWSSCIQMIVNTPPSIPIIFGTDEGLVLTSYDFEFLSFDPDGDQIQYEINWGDGSTELTSFSNSGIPSIARHFWLTENTYCVKARAIDIPLLATSGWSNCFYVTIGGVKNWPMFQYNARHEGSIKLNGPVINKTLWKFNTGGMIVSSPSIFDDIVYVGSMDGKLYAIYAVNGTLLWSYTTGDDIFSSPAIFNNVVYFGSMDGKFYALNAKTGVKIWEYNVGSYILSSPVVYQGMVFFTADNGRLYALDANTGAFKWSYSTSGAHLYSSPAASSNTIYFGDWNGKVYALYANNGTLKWSYSTGGIIEGAPTIVNNIVYIGSQDGKMYALYANNGTLKWSYSTGNMIYGSAVVDSSGSKVIFSSGSKVYALYTNGSLIWSRDLGGSTTSSVPIIAGALYVPTGNGLYALSPYSGVIGWNHSIGSFIESSAAIANITSSSRIYPDPIHAPNFYITGDNILFIGIGSSLYAIFDNSAPSTPTITGPTSGSKGVSYTYTFSSVDPNYDKIKYVVDWGDGTTSTSGYVDYNASYTISHTWSSTGTYTIKVTVYDEHLWNSTNTTTMTIAPTIYCYPLNFCYANWNNVTFATKSAVKQVTNIYAIKITVTSVNDSYTRCYGSWAKYPNGTYVALKTGATCTPSEWDGWCNCETIGGSATFTHNLADYGVVVPFTGTIETRVSDGCCGISGGQCCCVDPSDYPSCGIPSYWLVNWTSILFQDDFNDGNDIGWTRVKGTWNVVNGVYEQSDPFYNCTVDYISVAGNVNWVDYTLEADVRNIVNDSQSMSLVFRYIPNASVPLGGEFYRVMLEGQNAYIEYANGWDGCWVNHTEAGWEILASTPFNYDPLAWHHLKVEVTGPNIKFWVDGALVLTASDNRLTHGKIGLLSNTKTQFDNVIVHDDPSEPIVSVEAIKSFANKNVDKNLWKQNIDFSLLMDKEILYKVNKEKGDFEILNSLIRNSKQIFNYYIVNTIKGLNHLYLDLPNIFNFYFDRIKFLINIRDDGLNEKTENFTFYAYSAPEKKSKDTIIKDPPFRCPDFDKDEIINIEVIVRRDALGTNTKLMLGAMDNFNINKVEWKWSTGESTVIYSAPQRISGLPRCIKVNETNTWDNEITSNEEMTFICQFDARDYHNIVSLNNPLIFTIYTCWDGFDANGDGSFNCRADAISVFNASTTIGINGPLHDVKVKRIGSLDVNINSIIPSLESGNIEVNGTIDFVYQGGASRYALNSSTDGGDCPGGKCIVCTLIGADDEGVLWIREPETTRYDYVIDQPSWIEEWVGLLYKKSNGPLNLSVPGIGSFVSDYWFDSTHRTESSSYPKSYALTWANSLYNDTLIWFGLLPGAIDDPSGINNTLYYDSFQGCCNESNNCVNPNTYGTLSIKGVCGGGYKKENDVFKSTEFDESVNPSGDVTSGFHLIRFITTKTGFSCLKNPSVSSALNCNYDYYTKSCCVRKGMSCSEEEAPYNVYYANPETAYTTLLGVPMPMCSDATNRSYSEAKCEKVKFYVNKGVASYNISENALVEEKRFDNAFPQFNVKNSKTVKVENCDVNETGSFNCTIPYKEFKAKYLACVAKNKYASGYKVVSYNTTRICLNFQVSHDTIHTIYTDIYLPIRVAWNETHGFYYPDSPIYKMLSMLNQPPLTPNITGPSSGSTNTVYNFNANTTDPNGDLVKFVFDWGDGTTSESEFVDPSMFAMQMNHTWSSAGVYCVKVKAIDIHGAESNFSTCHNISIAAPPPQGLCGNGVIDPGEECDPTAPIDPCDWFCKPNCRCFVWVCLKEGSLILTPSGYRRIEDLKVGDLVIGYKDGNKVETKILKTAVHSGEFTLYYYKGYWFTGNHLVYTDDYKEFKPVTEFTNITKQYKGRVYDIQTEVGNYFGMNNFLIHNKPIPW